MARRQAQRHAQPWRYRLSRGGQADMPDRKEVRAAAGSAPVKGAVIGAAMPSTPPPPCYACLPALHTPCQRECRDDRLPTALMEASKCGRQRALFFFVPAAYRVPYEA